MPTSKEQEALENALHQLFRDDPSTYIHLMDHDKVRVINSVMTLLSERCWLKSKNPSSPIAIADPLEARTDGQFELIRFLGSKTYHTRSRLDPLKTDCGYALSKKSHEVLQRRRPVSWGCTLCWRKRARENEWANVKQAR